MNGLQHVVCRGAIDPDFVRQLASAPSEALRGFDLGSEEWAMLAALRPRTMDDLAREVESWRRGDLTAARPDQHAAPAAALSR